MGTINAFDLVMPFFAAAVGWIGKVLLDGLRAERTDHRDQRLIVLQLQREIRKMLNHRDIELTLKWELEKQPMHETILLLPGLMSGRGDIDQTMFINLKPELDKLPRKIVDKLLDLYSMISRWLTIRDWILNTNGTVGNGHAAYVRGFVEFALEFQAKALTMLEDLQHLKRGILSRSAHWIGKLLRQPLMAAHDALCRITDRPLPCRTRR